MSFLTRPQVIIIILLTAPLRIISSTVHASQPDRDANGATSKYLYHSWTVENGLPQNSVNDIVQTRDGYIWLATYGGLVRFDGVKFTVFDTGNSRGLMSNRVVALLEDRAGNLWIGTEQGGLSRYAHGAFTTFTVKDGLPDDRLRSVGEDDSGAIWVSTPAGLARYKDGRFTTYTKQDGIAGLPGQIRRGRDGSLWVFTDRGIVRFQGETFTVYETMGGLPVSWIRDMYCASDGSLWVSAAKGLIRFQSDTASTLITYELREGTSPPSNMVMSIFEDLQGRACFLSPQGLLRYEGGEIKLFANITKPFQAEEVVARVENQLNISRLQKELAEQNRELKRENDELVQAQKRTDLVFSALAELLPGTVLDEKYRLEEKIGSGGFGAVYRGTHISLNRPIAVKVFRPMAGNDRPEALERFRLEGVSASRINHPNAVAVLDSGITSAGIAYLVMELLEGHTLTEELRAKGRLSLRRALEILAPVCEALAEAHAVGIIHRDIKPDNIFLHCAKDGEVVKVVDFGLAKILGTGPSVGLEAMTIAGAVIGTPTYMAPERLANQPYDGRADIYSLGVILYRMLTGRLPFEPQEGDAYAVMVMHLTEEPPPPRQINPNIPEVVESIIKLTLKKQPGERPTAKEMSAMIGSLCASLDEIEPTSENGLTGNLTNKAPRLEGDPSIEDVMTRQLPAPE